MKKYIASVIGVSLLTACTCVEFDMNLKNKPSVPTYEGKLNFIYGGYAQTKEVDVQDICGHRGIAMVNTYQSVSDALFSIFTLGFYYPRTYQVWCQKEK